MDGILMALISPIQGSNAKYEKAIGEKLNFMDESDEVLKPNGTTGDKI